jgi:hypothetical protein
MKRSPLSHCPGRPQADRRPDAHDMFNRDFFLSGRSGSACRFHSPRRREPRLAEPRPPTTRIRSSAIRGLVLNSASSGTPAWRAFAGPRPNLPAVQTISDGKAGAFVGHRQRNGDPTIVLLAELPQLAGGAHGMKTFLRFQCRRRSRRGSARFSSSPTKPARARCPPGGRLFARNARPIISRC